MIPKIIHYCWFSGEEKPAFIKRCMESWAKYMPDYEIRCWDGDSFDFNSIPYTQEAMATKKYAHASDYVRLYALYTEGGIYLDTDVEVFKSFDDLLDCRFFSGVEQFPVHISKHKISGVCNHVQAAIMASEPGHPYVKDCLNLYQDLHFDLGNGRFDMLEIPRRITNVLHGYGFVEENRTQHIAEGVTIYNNTIIANNVNKIVPEGCYAFHWGVKSWGTEQRGKLYQFCWNHDLMKLYRIIENIVSNE